MNTDEMRIAIAEHLGAQRYGLRRHGLWYRTGAGGYTSSPREAWALPLEKAKKHERLKGSVNEHVTVEPLPTPNYPEDLNAIAEAEGKMEAIHWSEYVEQLRFVVENQTNKSCHMVFIYCATARQRAEAFLRTVGKWKGEGEQ